MTARSIVAGRDEGTALWHGEALWQFKIRSQDTENRFWLAELTAGQGWASPVHLHTREDETFHVLEGELWVQVDGEPAKVPAGGTAFLPRGVPHAYRVESGVARFLALGTPGGFDGWFFETGRPAEALTLPPPATEEPDWPAFVASLQAHGVRFIAPPPR
jgi:quercetin dioxygenase-like cupin family protein